MLRRVAVSAAVRTQLRRTLSSSATSPVIKPLGYVAHRSDAQDRIARVDVIEVDSDVALCDGGGGATGHPVEYIQLNKRAGPSPTTCKYCGLRYIGKGHGHH